jgi:hypothetical protein
MGAGDLLRDLDNRVLPPLARRMSRFGDGPTRLKVLTGVALLSVTAVLVTAVWTVDRVPQGAPDGPGLITVGVVEGQSVPGYVRNARGELAALLRPPSPGGAPVPTETYALVSLNAYFAPDRLDGVLGGIAVVEVYTRAPLTGVPTQVLRIPANRVPEDVVAGMLDAAVRRDHEQADYQRLVNGLDRDGSRQGRDGDGAADAADDDDARLRAAYGAAAQVAAAEATAYRSGCSCVFAAVVRATPAALARLAARTEIRAVDPAPEVRRFDLAEFRPPLPEQQTTVEESSSPVAGPQAPTTGRPRRTSPATAPAATPAAPSHPGPVTSTSPDAIEPTSEPSVETTPAPTAVPSALPASPSVTASP